MQFFTIILTAALCISSFTRTATHYSDGDDISQAERMSALKTLALLNEHNITIGRERLQFTPGTPPLLAGSFKDLSISDVSASELRVHQPRTAEQIITAFKAGRVIIENSKDYPDVGMAYLTAFFTTLHYTVTTFHTDPSTKKSAPAASSTKSESPKSFEAQLRKGMEVFCGTSQSRSATDIASTQRKSSSKDTLQKGLQKFFGGPAKK